MAQSLLPPDYQAQLQDVERQRRLAQVLQQQGMQPLPTRQAGRFQVAPSPLEGLAKVLQSYAGAQAGKQADVRGQEIVRQAGEARSNTLAQALAKSQGSPEIPLPPDQMGPGRAAIPPDPSGGMNILAQSTDPQLSAFGLQNMMPKRPEPYTLGPGQTRYGPQGNVVSSVPANPPPTRSVPPGGVVLGPDNKPVYTNPAKPEVDKPPAGYRKTPTGLEPIPGGPADLKAQGVFNQDTAILQNTQSNMDRLATAANEVLQHPGLEGITGLRGALPNIPGGAAANAQAKLDALKSQVGFSVLQEMRNNSKTGGALGQISDKENQLLQDNLAALGRAQSYDEYKTQLQKIIKYTQDAKGRLLNAYNLKHGDKTSIPSSPGSPPQGIDPAVWNVMTPQERALWQR